MLISAVDLAEFGRFRTAFLDESKIVTVEDRRKAIAHVKSEIGKAVKCVSGKVSENIGNAMDGYVCSSVAPFQTTRRTRGPAALAARSGPNFICFVKPFIASERPYQAECQHSQTYACHHHPRHLRRLRVSLTQALRTRVSGQIWLLSSAGTGSQTFGHGYSLQPVKWSGTRKWYPVRRWFNARERREL